MHSIRRLAVATIATIVVWAYGADADRNFIPQIVRGEAAFPVSLSTNAAGHVLFDFGLHQVGWVELNVVHTGNYEFVWGELLDGNGTIQTNELYTKTQGNVRYARAYVEFAETGWKRIPYQSAGAFNRKPIGRFGTVMPFRWMEVLVAPCPVSPDHVRQVPLYHPYDLSESSFKSDCDALNRVYTFCKHSIRATTYTGLFIDGDRERLPYEADSYITQLGTYAITSDQTLTRLMTDYLATHTTWPTEWKQFFIRMVYEDWRHSGKTDLMRKHWTLMRDVKSWRQLRRTDGLLVTPGAKMAPSPDGGTFCDIVDWAKCYRDGFVFTSVNAVVNALHYRNLKELAEMACAIGKEEEAAMFREEAAQTFDAYQRVLFNSSAGRYNDGEGTDHATVQANAMALACGIVPKERMGNVADYVASKGFSCSTYMAQFVLEALFAAGREKEAVRLMASDAPRSWLGMMAKGATITPEFWDLTMEEPGRIPDMNHSWSTAPLNMISRWVLGVTPHKPGFEEILVCPHPGPIKGLSGVVPTPHGPVRLEMKRTGAGWNVSLESPRPFAFKFGGRIERHPPGRVDFFVRLDTEKPDTEKSE